MMEEDGGRMIIRVARRYMKDAGEGEDWRYWLGKCMIMQVVLYADTGVFLHPSRRRKVKDWRKSVEVYEMMAYYEDMMKEWTRGFE
ncbi:MAG: hypothetical protein [Cressdnaviricota sp.]|nr:MAG: hypothetical protein [Cressdnaviricota sp.]